MMTTTVNYILFFFFVLSVCLGDKVIRVNPNSYELMNPGDVVQQFSLQTTNGTYTYIPMNDNTQSSIIFFALDPRSGFGEAMWENEIYVKNLFWRSPLDIEYIFLTYAPNSVDVATHLSDIFQQTMNDLKYTKAQKDQWTHRVHFCITPVDNIDNWIPQLLKQWPAVLDQAVVSVNDKNIPIKRLDGRWPWMSAIDEVLGNSSFPVSAFGDGCSSSSLPSNITGSIALVSRAENSSCYWSEKFLNAQAAGAVGVVVYSDEGVPLVDINCRKLSCYLTEIPVTMITYTAGQMLLDEIANNMNPEISFTANTVSGYYFAIDSMSELQEMGSIQYPSMSFLAWEGQYFDYYQNLLTTINDSTVPNTMDFVTNVYDNTIMDGPTNSTTFTLPAPSQLNKYQTLLLDMDLGCVGPKDSSCPAWDRILQVYICCGDVNSSIQNNGTESYFCEQEIGRWITPFGRRVGRWVTDVTALLPLFSSPNPSATSTECQFQITCGTTENWVPTLNLRFHDYQENKEHPAELLPLFQGGTFDSSYNDKYSPIEFIIPPNTSKVLLYAVITGHGSDNNNCAEFCVTSHHFVFNGNNTNTRTFRNAGTPLGCAHRSNQGVEPNEYGTWLYGRDGWCDGQEVDPWIVDVTEELDFTSKNTVNYYGYYNNATPDPTENPGYIVMYSYLSFYNEE